MLVMFNANDEFITVIANKDPTETILSNTPIQNNDTIF